MPAMTHTHTEDPTSALLPKKLARARPLFDPEIVRRALKDSFVKLNPLTLAKNPVIFVVEVGAAVTSILLAHDAMSGTAGLGFPLQIAIWLWFTVLFANFAEAMAEARGKAQADTLRKTRSDSVAKKLPPTARSKRHRRRRCGQATWCCATREISFPATAT